MNDNTYRNTIVTMLTFGVFAQEIEEEDLGALTQMAVGLFILPLLLFSATAGLFADRYPKRKMIIIIKFVEIILMLLAGIGFATRSIPMLMFVLFLMGMQSAFFGPIKYSYLPEIFPKESQLVLGNGLVSGSTHISILFGIALGTQLGGMSEEDGNAILFSSLSLMAIAIVGFFAALAIPAGNGNSHAQTAEPPPAVWNFLGHMWKMLWNRENINRPAFTAILGISWFWLVGALFLTLLPLFVSSIGHPVEVYKMLLLVTCLSVALGAVVSSLVTSRYGMRITPATCTISLVGISVFLIHFSLASGFQGPQEGSDAVGAFFAEGILAYWLVADTVAISFFEGVLIVPLITKMQQSSEAEHRASVVAANNIYNSLLIVIGSLATGVLIKNILEEFNDVYGLLGLGTLAFSVFLFLRMKGEPIKSEG